MDMNEIIKTAEDLAGKLAKDSTARDAFMKDPVKTLEDTFKVDLPDEQINAVVDAIKAKLTVDNAKGAVEALGKLFQK